MKNIVDTIVQKLHSQLGDQLEAIFLYGSLAQGFHQPGESDINLFMVVSDDTNIHELRKIFFPIWQKHKDVLKRAPCLATPKTFDRHLRLNRLLAHHLVRDGQKLWGSKRLLDKDIDPLNPAEAYAYLAHQAMIASQALIPEILDEETAVSSQRILRSFVRRIQRAPIKEAETNIQLFARVQHYLLPIIEKLPEIKSWNGFNVPTTTSPFLPGLSAIYEETSKLVLAFSRLTPHQLLRTDWQAVTEQVPKTALGVEITSAAQLYLIASFEHPLHLRFRKYEHSWGPDFLAELNPPRDQILRQAARLPSRILVEALPNAILTQGEEAYSDHVHDFQNKLLNIQLEHELMVRFELIEKFTPPEPLPGRNASLHIRIEAIIQNLEWWTEFYCTQIET